MLDFSSITERLENIRKLAEFGDQVRERVKKLLEHGPVPDLRLKEWLGQPQQRYILVLTGALACYAALKLIVLVHHIVADWGVHADSTLAPTPRDSDAWAGLFNALFKGSSLFFVEAVFLVCIVWYINSKGSRDETLGDTGIRRAARSENQFIQYWWPLWGTWFLLYTFMGLSSLKHWDQSANVEVLGLHVVISDFLNNLSGVMFYGMYHVLSEDTGDNHGSQSRQVWFPIVLLLVLLAVGEYSFATAHPLPFAQDVFRCGSILSGLFVGTMTALFVAKLASRIIDLPQWELALLAMYAVLQAMYPALSFHEDRTTSSYIGYAVAVVALYSKVVLFAVVEWARDEYRIQYYMLRARQIYLQERREKQHDLFAYHARELYSLNADSDELVKESPPPGSPSDLQASGNNVVPIGSRENKGEKDSA